MQSAPASPQPWSQGNICEHPWGSPESPQPPVDGTGGMPTMTRGSQVAPAPHGISLVTFLGAHSASSQDMTVAPSPSARQYSQHGPQDSPCNPPHLGGYCGLSTSILQMRTREAQSGTVACPESHSQWLVARAAHCTVPLNCVTVVVSDSWHSPQGSPRWRGRLPKGGGFLGQVTALTCPPTAALRGVATTCGSGGPAGTCAQGRGVMVTQQRVLAESGGRSQGPPGMGDRQTGVLRPWPLLLLKRRPPLPPVSAFGD